MHGKRFGRGLGDVRAFGRCLLAVTTALALLGAAASAAQAAGGDLEPGNLLLSRDVYSTPANLVAGETLLPPGCLSECALATDDGTYPYVWNNTLVDPSFGITSQVFLDQLTPSGSFVDSLEVPNSTQPGVPPTKDQLVGSFSSKSEGALGLSPDGQDVTFIGYVAPVDALDVSNSNTPGIVDPTNPDPGAYYRAVAQLDRHGKLHFTETNAYSGDNGRAAIFADGHLYAAGNAGNGANPQPDGIIVGTGAQILDPETKAEVAQRPGLPTPVGSFNVTQLGLPIDKIGKDTNFRGIAIANKVLYYTKGSGSNGVNTVYFLDTTGHACPNGVGLPQPGAPLPTSPLEYDPALLQSKGLRPNNMCILKGFPTALKSKTSFPFGLWFANDHTLYVADEGNGDTTYSAASGTYTKAAAQTTAGIQKWVLEEGTWKLAYTLQAGLGLGQPYSVPGYPSGNNPATGLPWAPATDGLRNIAGRVNRDGTATIWAVTATVSGNGDVGADPNKLVAVTDDVGATSRPAGESFKTVRAAGFGEVLRGISLAPGTAPQP